jgi:hypothetical protein
MSEIDGANDSPRKCKRCPEDALPGGWLCKACSTCSCVKCNGGCTKEATSSSDWCADCNRDVHMVIQG